MSLFSADGISFFNLYFSLPTFSRDLWNVSARIVHDLPRTTNGLEGFHSALATSIKIDHPNIWILMKQLKQEKVTTLAAIADSQATTSTQSKHSSQKARKYEKLTHEIQDLLQQLHESELAVLPFLRLIAHRIEIAV